MNFSHVPVFESEPRLHSSALSLSFSRGWLNTADWWRGRKTCSQDSNFICVCVFVPPSSVLQISQLHVELKGVESTLSAPISSLRLVSPIYTQTHMYTLTNMSPSCSFTLFSLLDLSLSLILLPSLPSFPSSLPRLIPRSQHSFLCLSCEHHTRTNDVLLLCRTSTLCPLVLLLGNRPGWRFWRGFISCAWLWMTSMHVKENKESGKQRKRERKGS